MAVVKNLLILFLLASSEVYQATTGDPINSPIDTFRKFLGATDLDETTLLLMIQDFFRNLLASCIVTTKYSYWVCNKEDLYGTILNADNYQFKNRTQFPGNYTVVETTIGAYIQSLMGAFLTQKIHEYRLLYMHVCGVNLFNSTSDLDTKSLSDCTEREFRRAEDVFDVFRRRYERENPASDILIRHNMKVGTKLFKEMLYDDENSPCRCILGNCVSLKLLCYNHNTQASFLYKLAAHLSHWSDDARMVHDYDKNSKQLYQKDPDDPNNSRGDKIGYKRQAYLKKFEWNCDTVIGRECVRTKSYDVCSFGFSSYSSYQQRYLKKSCSNLCNKCLLDVEDEIDRHYRKCINGETAKSFYCVPYY